MVHKNGSVYFGQFKNSKKHGICYFYEDLNSTTESKKTRKKEKFYADKIENI